MADILLSIIIPARPGHVPERALNACRSLLPSDVSAEILVVFGNAPSAQRNAALAGSCGDIIYFLDDDSEVLPGAIESGLRHFEDPRVDVVGGICLTGEEASVFERVVGAILASPLVAGRTAARHAEIDSLGELTGDEFLLCNLMVRRTALEAHEGFDTNLYPSEDPEFMKRVVRSGMQVVYEPLMAVNRPKRKDFFALARQFYRYGRGRAQHIFQGFRAGDLVFFAPSILLIITLLGLSGTSGVCLLLLALYAACASVESFRIAKRSDFTAPHLLFMSSILTVHFSYGLGFLLGLITSRSRTASDETTFPIERHDPSAKT